MIVDEQPDPLVRGPGQPFPPQPQVVRERQGGERAGPVGMLPHPARETLEIGAHGPIAGENVLEALGALGDDGSEGEELLVRTGGRGFLGRGRVPSQGPCPSSESRYAKTVGRGHVFGVAAVPVIGGDGVDVVETALKLCEIKDYTFACVDVFLELRQESVQVSFELERYSYSDHGTCGVTTESPDEISETGVSGSPGAIA